MKQSNLVTNMSKLLILLFCMSFIIFNGCSHQVYPIRNKDYSENCYENNAPDMAWNVCITRMPGSTSKDVLFYFHGIYDNQHAWLNSPLPPVKYRREVAKWWEDNGKQPPTVVVFSLGRKFLLTPHAGRYLEPTVSWFVEKALPIIQKHIGPKEGKYIMWGASMGGQNVAQLYMRYPKMWDKVILTSPLIPICDPYAPDKGDRCVKEIVTPHSNLLARSSLDLIREFYQAKDKNPTKSRELWENGNPLRVGPSLITSNHPPIMIQISHDDEFGFYPGTKHFMEIVKQKGGAVEYLEHAGGVRFFNPFHYHFYIDSQKVAKFVVED